VARRKHLLQNLSTINVLLLFGGLVFLLLTDPTMNFIVGVLLFLLARQILSRSLGIFADANFFMQNRERVDALVYPGRHLREKRSSDRSSFERLLMPGRRARVFEAVERAGATHVADREWQWRDTPGAGVALFVSAAMSQGESEYRLKVKMRQGDAGLARETMFYRSDSAEALGLSCEFVDAGSVFGRGYLLLRSGALKPCPPDRVREMGFRVRTRLWQHRLDKDLIQRLLRSFPSLDARLTPERLSRIRLACNDYTEEKMLDELLRRLPRLTAALQRLPRVLCNQTLTESNILLSESGDPVVLNWEAIRYDVIGTGLTPTDLDREYSDDSVREALGNSDSLSGGLPLAVHAGQLDQLIGQEAYGAALGMVSELLDMLERVEGRPAGHSSHGLVSAAYRAADPTR